MRALGQPETPLPLPDLPSPNKEVCSHLARPGLIQNKIILCYIAIVRAHLDLARPGLSLIQMKIAKVTAH